jgi:virulence factor
MLESLLKRYTKYRKASYFSNPLFAAKRKYACIGTGIHSLANIYPVLRHFNIPLKYICTHTSGPNAGMEKLFPGSVQTNDVSVIAKDPEIDAVIICASPDAHFGLLKELIAAGKKIFVEKPPCRSGDQLDSLIALNRNIICKVGLQRRYWPGNRYLQKQLNLPQSYLYRFYFGTYLQGNVVNELFIHCIDYSIFLFGACQLLSSTFQRDSRGITIQMHVKHTTGTIGLLEMSSHYSWADPVDSISIQEADEILTVEYPLEVCGKQKPRRLLNLPAERLLHQPLTIRKYFGVNNLVIPATDMNTLVLQGFYSELENFIGLVESGKNTQGENDLISLQPVYHIMDQLNAHLQRTASL